MKILYKNVIIIISVLMAFLFVFSNYTYASSDNEFDSFNNAPKKYFSVASNKFSDVKITIKDGNGISLVELYSVDSNGKNAKKIKFSSSNTKNSKKHIYVLSHKNLLKGKTKYFYIKIKNLTMHLFLLSYHCIMILSICKCLHLRIFIFWGTKLTL